MAATAPPISPWLLYAARQVTERAACAAADWIGRGDKDQGDDAAVEAMRRALQTSPISGVVVIGEGAKDEAPHLYNGERLGPPDTEAEFDIAVDPIEGTSYLAKGLTNAMSVIALAPRGALFDPGPTFYMEKFAAPPVARGRIDIAWPLEQKLETLAELLGKPVGRLTVFVLEKPRHRRLVERLHGCGVRVALYPAGDVAGGLMAAIPDSGIDCLMGTGGTPEGIITACAVKALGGLFMGRLDPQLPSETVAVREAGLDTGRWHDVDELVGAQDVLFCASGITTGLLFDGIEHTADHYRVQTLMICGATGERQLITNHLPAARCAGDSAADKN